MSSTWKRYLRTAEAYVFTPSEPVGRSGEGEVVGALRRRERRRASRMRSSFEASNAMLRR